MKERSAFLTKDQSLILRGIAIIMVMASHYVIWYMDLVTSEPVRYAVSRLGIYGVDLFFLVSGYGLAKSGEKKTPGAAFWVGRLRNTYVPYLLIAAALALLNGEGYGPEGIYQLLTGYQYWFIRNILVFYLAFFAIFRLTPKKWLRAALLFAFLAGYGLWLTKIGRAPFWVVSNLSFGIGALAALYEKKLLNAAKTAWPLQLALLAGLMLAAAKNGMDVRFATIENADKMLPGTAASAVWTLLCLQIACLLPNCFILCRFLGKISLELYLLHQVVYNQIVNVSGISGRLLQGMVSLLLTAALAWLIDRALRIVWAFWDNRAKTEKKKERTEEKQ